jgi:hypothetical protein
VASLICGTLDIGVTTGNLGEPFLLGFRVLVWFKNRQLARLMIPKGKKITEESDDAV